MKFRAFILSLFFAFTVQLLLSCATNAKDVAGARDHPLFPRISGSEIIDYKVINDGEYSFVFGRPVIDKGFSGDKIVIKEKKLVTGRITKIRYAYPRGDTTLDIFRRFANTFKGLKFNLLFSCADKNCGTDFFDIVYKNSPGILNGADKRYLSTQLVTSQGIIQVTLYSLVHEDIYPKYEGRVIADLHIIETLAEDADKKEIRLIANAALLKFKKDGHLVLGNIDFEGARAELLQESNPTLAVVAKILMDNPEIELYVVGHTNDRGNLDTNIDLSKARAEAVIDAISARYNIDRDRLTAVGVSFFSPRSTNRTEEGRDLNER
ncbi:MAG: DUF4892 domain-containing protein, partial [Thermodesulfobacteriota bacterium]